MRPLCLAALALASMLLAAPSAARDQGQWQASPSKVRDWYRNLMQPDEPMISCCGEADAYWADDFAVEGNHYVAIITDDRDDAPLGRPHLDPGKRFAVPNTKLKYDAGNPTGHGVIFIRIDGVVLCFIVPPGT
jgi:hypothetical protein